MDEALPGRLWYTNGQNKWLYTMDCITRPVQCRRCLCKDIGTRASPTPRAEPSPTPDLTKSVYPGKTSVRIPSSSATAAHERKPNEGCHYRGGRKPRGRGASQAFSCRGTHDFSPGAAGRTRGGGCAARGSLGPRGVVGQTGGR